MLPPEWYMSLILMLVIGGLIGVRLSRLSCMIFCIQKTISKDIIAPKDRRKNSGASKFSMR